MNKCVPSDVFEHRIKVANCIYDNSCKYVNHLSHRAYEQ